MKAPRGMSNTEWVEPKEPSMSRILLATTALAAILAMPAYAQDSSSMMSSESSMMSSESSMMDSSMSSMESSAMDSSAMDSSAMDSSMMSSMPMDTASSAVTDTTVIAPRTPVDILAGYTVVDSDQLVSRIINAPVYTSAGDDAEQLGTINDLILNENGEVAAVVLGVGGFLGLGEKQVAVDFAALQYVVATDSTKRFVLETTVENLTAAPDFQVVEDASPDTDATTSDPMAASSMMSSAQ
jgi:hypothetical protein